MSPKALRVTAIPFGLLAFAASVAVMFYAGVDWLWLAAAVVPLCLFFGFVAWRAEAKGLRRAPDDSALVATGSPWTLGGSVVALGALAAEFVVIASTDDPTRSQRWHDVRLALPEMAILAIAYLAVAFVMVVADRPSVRLTPDGIEVAGVLRRKNVAWDEIALDGAVVTGPKRRRHMVILLQEDTVGDLFVASIDFPMQNLYIDADALAETINTYVAHPELRAVIGGTSRSRALEAKQP